MAPYKSYPRLTSLTISIKWDYMNKMGLYSMYAQLSINKKRLIIEKEFESQTRREQ